MKKIEFDIIFKDAIINGFYSVLTENGESVEIVKWNCKGDFPILGVIFDGDTDDACFYNKKGISACGDKIYIVPKDNSFKSFLKWVIKQACLLAKDGVDEDKIDTTIDSIIEKYLVVLLKCAVGLTIMERRKNETATNYLLRCLSPELRDVWYEACDEMKE